MNFDRITRMAICYWSDDDDSFVVESPIFNYALGMGDTPQEAFSEFEQWLAGAGDALAQGRHITDTGRNVTDTLITEINSRTDRTLHILTHKFNCSLNEAVDYLALHYEHSRLIDGSAAGREPSAQS